MLSALSRVAWLWCVVLLIWADGLLAADAVETANRIDASIDAKLQAENLGTVATADEAEFLRRIYLDLTGQIPTARQAASYLDSSHSNKRTRLIDELLASPQYGEHFGRVWRDWIAPAELPSEGNGGNQPIAATRKLGVWFAEQFNQNEPWDRLVYSVLTVDGELADHPEALFYSLVGTDTGIPQPAGATRAVGTLFLGLQLQCAECHDDPFRAWKQSDFWGAAAFFRNTEATFDGRYFASVTETFGKETSAKGKRSSKKTTRNDRAPNGSITIPSASFTNSGTVIAGKFPAGAALTAEARQPLRPILAEWIVSPENPYFSRAFVNRMWSYFFVRGIVNPIDDFRPDNPPSHPEVLELLAAEFRSSGFDVKNLIRGILNARVYQRTNGSDPQADPNQLVKQVDWFARYPLKLMSTDMLFESLKLALEDPALDLRTVDPALSSKFGESTPIGDAYQEFRRLFETNEDDATDFRHGIPQFLALMNHPRLSAGGKTVERLLKENLEPTTIIEQLYLGTLSRRPTSEEADEAARFVQESAAPRVGYNGLLWMLINRSEFLLIR
ncbi:MAG: DUF1549 and DUF1553 domain-containing protein [Planctomycetota bacterium]|nr:DUF1549 and DUF1553 domain-containing protein [Planctomycetota bacterium]